MRVFDYSNIDEKLYDKELVRLLTELHELFHQTRFGI